MKKFVIFTTLLIILSSCSATSEKSVVINNIKVDVEIADTDELRYNGLSNREELCDNCGMLFSWNDKKERIFVMRNMNFALDIIFIDDDEIVEISKNAFPEGKDYVMQYKSGEPVNYVLEVNAGFCDEYDIEVGDGVEINL
ncbi:MAG: DUF192 domain-containing protein [Candidatus Falkowbacteria bacterium]